MKKENGNSKGVEQNSLTDSRKMTIINVALLTLVGTQFKPQIEKISAWGENEAEQAFTKEVFDAIGEASRNAKIDAEFKRQLKKNLYDRFGVSKEQQIKAQEEAEKKAQKTREYIEKERAKWKKQDDRVTTKTIDIVPILEKEKKSEYKKGLYNPQLIASANNKTKAKAQKPLVKLKRHKPEDTLDYEYEFEGMQYIIRRTGELLYKTSLGVGESISEYQITMKKENRILSIRKFGHISISNMEYEAYRREVFTTLLGKNNMEDPELYSYIGSLEKVEGRTAEIQPYKIAHSSEEYTAVMLFEELERKQARDVNTKPTRVSGEGITR